MSEASCKTEWLQELRKLDNKPSLVTTLDSIEKFGWEAMMVHSNQQKFGFAYTVGLYDTMKFPELIVVGLKSEVAHSALQYTIEEMQKGGDLTGKRLRNIVGEIEVEFRPVSQDWFRHVMCRAGWYYGHGKSPIPALQIIYPDLEGRFQWDEGFQEYFHQPLLQPDVERGV